MVGGAVAHPAAIPEPDVTPSRHPAPEFVGHACCVTITCKERPAAPGPEAMGRASGTYRCSIYPLAHP
jgi:hypothetical protein